MIAYEREAVCLLSVVFVALFYLCILTA